MREKRYLGNRNITINKSTEGMKMRVYVWIKTNGKYGHRNKSKQLNKYCSFIVLILLMFTLKKLIHLFTSISSKRRNEWKPHNIGAAQDNNQ